jgi:hypothetical protein
MHSKYFCAQIFLEVGASCKNEYASTLPVVSLCEEELHRFLNELPPDVWGRYGMLSLSNAGTLLENFNQYQQVLQ